MQKSDLTNWYSIESFPPILVLGALMFFTYLFLVRVPYAGFYFNPTNGRVVEVYIKTKPTDLLRSGDMIEQIGAVSWESYRGDTTQGFFDHLQAGQQVNISVRRDGREVAISWLFPGFNRNEFLARFLNIWWLGYVLWAFGLLTQFLIRPRDARRNLLIAADYLTALWLVCGTMSGSHVGESSLVLRATTWLILPVYLHLHWDFPRPLARIPRTVWLILYAVGSVFALLEFLQILPRSLYALGFALAALGSMVLLAIHFILQPSRRRAVGLLVIVLLLAMLPSIGLGIARLLGEVTPIGPVALLALPIVPAAYFFVIYQRHLGGLELRANRIMLVYSFSILMGTILILLLLPGFLILDSARERIILATVAALLTPPVSIVLFPAYQSFVEQRLLGIKLPYQNLQETYSNRITASTSIAGLLKLLEEEVFPSLLVKQFAFFQISSHGAENLLAKGLRDRQLPRPEDIPGLIPLTGGYFPASADEDPTRAWIRLILPLKIGDDLIGLWLLGRRDPDDLYPQAEIPILQALANQTAVALSNIVQTERLKALYEANIERYEQERSSLGRDLHDSVLNEIAAILIHNEAPVFSPAFQKAFEAVTERLREIVSELRPPGLSYGLKLALEALVDNLSERNHDSVRLTADIQTDGDWRYPEKVENYLYRIAQEACENALKYSRAHTVKVIGGLSRERIELEVRDDGIGFEAEIGLKPDGIPFSGKHYGLIGMQERASLINAQISIHSKPGEGTRIQVVWEVKKSI